MGSISHSRPEARGTFTVPVYDGKPHEAPTERAYFVPPKPKQTLPVTFPVVDYRDDVFPGIEAGTDAAYSHASKVLSQNGFTAVKHTSAVTSMGAFDEPDSIGKVYYLEVCDIVKRITGAKLVIPVQCVRRGGPLPQNYFPIGFKMSKEEKEDQRAMSNKPLPSKPTAAERSRVIEKENEICSAAEVDPMQKESDEAVAAKYNEYGELGPRYAALSVWRGLKTVTRDPLVFSTYEDIERDKRLVVEPYLNRIAGLNGDWLRELQMLVIKVDKEDTGGSLKWRYISHLQADELLFVKLFDSAGHLRGGPESDGLLHGSPDLGDAAYGDNRESLEVRLFAFW